jgi:hypothetical protein
MTQTLVPTLRRSPLTNECLCCGLGLAIRVVVSSRWVNVSTRLTNLVKNVSLMRHNYVINELMSHKRVINKLADHKRVINGS